MFNTLRLKKGLKVNISIGVVSVIFALYIMEISLFLWEQTPWRVDKKIERAAKKAGIPYDTRTKWQIIQDLRRNGIDAYPVIFPHYFLPNGLKTEKNAIFPLSGISMKTTVLCNESGEWITYVADEYGFNNPPSSWTKRETDIMLIGDSFAQGICVKPGEDIAGQLRKYGWTAINIGMGGHGPLLGLASLKEYTEPLKPKIVIWLYYEDNDPVDLKKEKKSSFLMQYLQEGFSQNLIRRQAEIDEILHQYIEKEIEVYRPHNVIFDIIRLKHIWFRLKRFNPGLSKKPYQFPDIDPLFGEILKRARDRVTTWGGELYFVYLPTWSRYTDKNKDDNQYCHRQEVLSIVHGLGIPIIDLHQEVFLKHPDPLSLIPFRVYGHYNAEAYKLFAEAIDKHLKKK